MPDLPLPPVPADCDLTGYPFMPLPVRWVTSGTFLKATTGSEFKAAFLLLCHSWLQVPAASIPGDDRALADLLHLTARQWKRVRDRALHGWSLHADGRFYHHEVVALALRAWTRHHRLRHAAKRLRRPKRIRGSRWAKIRARILERDGHACVKCSAKSPLEIDHIMPLAEGGDHLDSNLRVLCKPCNGRKSYRIEGVR